MLLGVNYTARLDKLGLLPWDRGRMRGDLKEFYKIMRMVYSHCLFVMPNTRRHSFKVRNGKFKGKVLGKIFLIRE